jgi:lysozyme family protein
MSAQGDEASFQEGMPDVKTVAFMKSLPPGALVGFMSDAKAAQYKKIAAEDPFQQKFLEGWLKRNEERRLQARKLANTQTIRGHAQQALARGRSVLQAAPDYDAMAKSAAMLEISALIGRMERQQAQEFANEDDELSILSLKGQLLSKMGRVMDLGL